MTEIRKNVPVPSGDMYSRHIDAAIRGMEPGDSFTAASKNQRQAFWRFGKLQGWNIKTRTVDGYVMCWRES